MYIRPNFSHNLLMSAQPQDITASPTFDQYQIFCLLTEAVGGMVALLNAALYFILCDVNSSTTLSPSRHCLYIVVTSLDNLVKSEVSTQSIPQQ